MITKLNIFVRFVVYYGERIVNYTTFVLLHNHEPSATSSDFCFLTNVGNTTESVQSRKSCAKNGTFYEMNVTVGLLEKISILL